MDFKMGLADQSWISVLHPLDLDKICDSYSDSKFLIEDGKFTILDAIFEKDFCLIDGALSFCLNEISFWWINLVWNQIGNLVDKVALLNGCSSLKSLEEFFGNCRTFLFGFFNSPESILGVGFVWCLTIEPEVS
ncbi:hypothetical protein KFK09_001776 [Dendrobium nobile]|uniref:Uncharacterized protein n=1 Tax=Dendrobium nobile TaxID=94219 RepID=A0A8T3CAH4_DENNO|nr:hypothetical protein KFK09_001776 [Dendrobium nobile]